MFNQKEVSSIRVVLSPEIFNNMVNNRKILKDLSRQRQVEKEFATEGERKLVQKKTPDTVGIKINKFEELP